MVNYYFHAFHTDFDLPTYEEAILMDEEIDINLQSIEDSLAKLQVKLTE